MAKAISKPLALAVAVGLTLGGSFGAGAPAFAQNSVNAPQVATQAPPASTIPAGNNFSLTIHKRVNSQTLRNATGQEDQEAGGEPLAGAEFTIRKLAGDVRTQAGLQSLVKKANDFNRTQAPTELTESDFDGAATAARTTGVDGKIEYTGLAAGAYLVTETQTPTVGDNDARAYVPSRPFIVMVPMTNASGDGWNSSVHVYPKNSEARVEKQVVDANKHASTEKQTAASSVVEYTLDGVVPAAPQGRQLKDFKLTDSSRSDELRFDTGFVKRVQRIPAGQTEANAVTIGEEWYTVSAVNGANLPTNQNNIASGADQAFTITVADPAGAGLMPGDTLRVVVEATMLQAPDQQIENSVNESGVFRDPTSDFDDESFETPNDKVTTYIGKIRVVKFEEGTQETANPVKLQGAEFELYNCAVPGTTLRSGVTNDQGELLFEGIHVSDWVNDEAPGQNVEYCLRETKAPDGYLPLEEDIRGIQLLRTSQGNVTSAEGENTQVRLVSRNVTNKPSTDVPILPSTGGMGILLVALLGLGIIAGGVYAARRNSAKA
ncbi:SpaH/EbpB family LPXTG-anchored major pilin [Corynebacterium pseudodiphtheriticum]|uniref:SpaH/EbpB family LPXTG-anchored major pilin n=1 Tax=Corynebacterium pseudodiphtheriticum TaxID=37637 RepID=UPI00254F8834|nr:SpaH/EbpB family LPXTG-anchored major pilin [Corynebacterium pseudodiphtheriticum]MDK8760143.1 SpaH/EbpB family LPXTG-anchored major pilin [Corynebacterium pseudodiphtheriticum]